jgi:hypothetical protein
MPGKAAASPGYWGTRATENAASAYVRGSRGNVEQRGAFPWGAHQRDRANAKRLWARDTGDRARPDPSAPGRVRSPVTCARVATVGSSTGARAAGAW